MAIHPAWNRALRVAEAPTETTENTEAEWEARRVELLMERAGIYVVYWDLARDLARINTELLKVRGAHFTQPVPVLEHDQPTDPSAA